MNGVGPTEYVVVSTFPPRHCGIGRYAQQFVNVLVGNGHSVARIALPDSKGEVQLPLGPSAWPWYLLRATSRDTVQWIMWHPGLYLGGRPIQRLCVLLGFAAVVRLRQTRVVIHEQSTSMGAAKGLSERLERSVAQLMWTGTSLIAFHSEAERRQFLTTFPRVQTARTELIEHGASFRASTTATKFEARSKMGMASNDSLLLCIGFLGPHKGFDRAISAFGRATNGSPGASKLVVVGSALYDLADVRTHIALLRARAAETAGVTLVERWLSDEEFDLWLQAADVVIAPYREICSSGVVARAKLFSKPLIVANVGSLPEQISHGDVVITSDEDLCRAIKKAISGDGEGLAGCTSVS